MKLKPIIINCQVDTQSELKYIKTDFCVSIHFY